MGINVKAMERNVSFDKNTVKYAYVMQPVIYNQLSQDKVVQEAALRSGMQKGVLSAAWNSIGEVIKSWATEGHSVAIPGLGTMRFGLRSTSVDDVKKVSSSLITARRIVFLPSTEIKQELADTSISITCYDRNGKQVSNVTSKDDGDVEDNTDNTGDNTDTTGGNTDTQTGGNTDTQTGDNSGEESAEG